LKILSAVIALVVSVFIFTGGVTGYGYVLLVEATEQNNTSQAKRLLFLNVPVNSNVGVKNWYTQSQYSESPLQTAARMKNWELVTAIVRRKPFMDYRCCASPTALQHAIKNKDFKMVNLLLENGADPTVNYGIEGYNSLVLAERASTKEIVTLIKSHNE
jgi:ankyrin repeat protein